MHAFAHITIPCFVTEAEFHIEKTIVRGNSFSISCNNTRDLSLNPIWMRDNQTIYAEGFPPEDERFTNVKGYALNSSIYLYFEGFLDDNVGIYDCIIGKSKRLSYTLHITGKYCRSQLDIINK